VSIATENALPGENPAQITIGGYGDALNQGFCREFSVNVGETANFSCSGTGTVLDIYRIGFYGGNGWRKVTTLTNTATTQPAPTTVPNSNGATTCTGWSTTASWTVPAGTTSGLFVGVLRNVTLNNASWIPFIVRDDSLVADIIYKVADATWALAYNCFGSMAAIEGGKNVYGSAQGIGNIIDRCHYVSHHRPVVTRGGVAQTYWYACEYPMIRWLERNGFNVKYIACKDLDRDPTILNKAPIFISNGHDEYWSDPMRSNVEAWRNDGGHALFASGNEVFWRTRYDATRDGYWCFKDTMNGPGGHVAGVPLDPVTWTGSWKDQRWAGNKPEWTITGTDFRMNGVIEFDAVISTATFGSHPVWANTAVVSSNVTIPQVIGFEADNLRPTQPSSSVRTLAATTVNINGRYADDNGQNYNGNGDLTWGIVSQRFHGGGVTVGFGTCEWSWALDATHDRAGAPVTAAAQQFTINLLGDLGAQPVTLMGGMVARTPQSLDIYGFEPLTGPAGWELGDGTDLDVALGSGVPLATSLG
jgi:hypothetical protein